MNVKYLILIIALLAVIHYLLAGSAPIATPAGIAAPARVGPVAPSPAASSAPVATPAPIGTMPSVAPVAPVANTPIAPLAPIPPQPYNFTFPANPYTYTYGSTNSNFTKGVPTAYLRNRNSVYWATNPPYGNPVEGYTNNTIRGTRPNRHAKPIRNGSSPATQQ